MAAPNVIEHIYIIVTPRPNDGHVHSGALGMGPRRYWIKIGDHKQWNRARKRYKTNNPSCGSFSIFSFSKVLSHTFSVWFRSIRINRPQDLTLEPHGIKPGNSISYILFESAVRLVGYNRLPGTEWFETTDPARVAQINNMMNQWDQSFVLGQVNNFFYNVADPLTGALVQRAGSVTGIQPIVGQPVGPECNRRTATAEWLHTIL